MNGFFLVPTRDHVNPRARGGKLDDEMNKIICCNRCNTEKGSRTLEEYLGWLEETGNPKAKHVREVVDMRGLIIASKERAKLRYR